MPLIQVDIFFWRRQADDPNVDARQRLTFEGRQADP